MTRALRIVGYVAFFMASFVIGLYLSFPWNALKDRLLTAASVQTGWSLQAETMRPSWLTGVVLTGVEARPPGGENALEINELHMRASVLSMLTGGVGGQAAFPLGGGEVDATFSQSSSTMVVDLDLHSVELGLVPVLAELTGLPISGELTVDAELDVDRENPSKSSGTVRLAGDGLEIAEGGRIGVYPLPISVNVGSFDWSLQVSNGQLKLTQQEIRGGDVEVNLDGTLNLAAQLERSTTNMTLAFRPTEALLEREPLIGALLNNIASAKGRDGFYTYAMTGSVKHPRLFPKRGR
ncbi:MAG: type II secretion system protein GspN [Myxococcota bacterium]